MVPVVEGVCEYVGMNTRTLGAFYDELALVKEAEIELLTGLTGAGKSTLTRKIGKNYDLVFGTDTGRALSGGQYYRPTKARKLAARVQRAQEILGAHAEGKKILVEGYPPGIMKLPGVAQAAGRTMVIDLPLSVRAKRVAKRSKQRGTSVTADLRYMNNVEDSAQEHMKNLMKTVGAKNIEYLK